jgi:hypothetical protein
VPKYQRLQIAYLKRKELIIYKLISSDRYKEKFLSGLPPQQRSHADFSRPVFTVVSFFLAAKQSKSSVDKKALITDSLISPKEFDIVVKSMSELLGIDTSEENKEVPTKSPGKQPADPDFKPGRKKEKLNDVLVVKRQRELEDEDSDLEGEDIAPGAEIPGLKKSKKRMKKEEYLYHQDCIGDCIATL